MISTVISLLVALAILAIVYYVLTWILGYFNLPAPVGTIINIIFGVLAVIQVLRFADTLL
jgi:hypothetical protein